MPKMRYLLVHHKITWTIFFKHFLDTSIMLRIFVAVNDVNSKIHIQGKTPTFKAFQVPFKRHLKF